MGGRVKWVALKKSVNPSVLNGEIVKDGSVVGRRPNERILIFQPVATNIFQPQILLKIPLLIGWMIRLDILCVLTTDALLTPSNSLYNGLTNSIRPNQSANRTPRHHFLLCSPEAG